MFPTTRGVGQIILRTLFLSILLSRFSRFFSSLPATIFQRAVGLRFQFFFAFVFLFLSSCSFVCSSHFFLSFFFSFSLFSLFPSFFFSLYFEFTGRALGYRYRDPPRHFSLYRRPSADGLEGPTMPGRESSIMFAVFSRVGVTCSDGRPCFRVCFISFISYFQYSLPNIFARDASRVGERHG
jgi:hypothetical protein